MLAFSPHGRLLGSTAFSALDFEIFACFYLGLTLLFRNVLPVISTDLGGRRELGTFRVWKRGFNGDYEMFGF